MVYTDVWSFEVPTKEVWQKGQFSLHMPFSVGPRFEVHTVMSLLSTTL